jgi:hypothetical protein
VLKKSLHDHYFVFLTKHLISAFFWGRGRDEFLHCGDNVFLENVENFPNFQNHKNWKKNKLKNHACHK